MEVILNKEHNNHLAADNSDRRRWQNPEAILASIGLKPGLTFADIGCGGGFFTLPAARITGETGKVYGLDVNPSYIHELKELALNENLHNLELTIGKAEEIVLCDNCIDIIFFGVVLHDFVNAYKVLENAKIMLKSTGRLVNLDWKKEPMDKGPKLQKRFSIDEAKQLIIKAGLRIEDIRDMGAYHYMIIASKRVSVD